MKTRKTVFFLVLLLILCAVLIMPALAYDTDLFAIDIDSDFTQCGESYIWYAPDGRTNICVVVKNNTLKENFWNATDKTLDKYAEDFTKSVKSEIEAYEKNASVDIKSLSADWITVNGSRTLFFDCRIAYSIFGQTAETHQYSYTFTAKNNVYNITFTMIDDDNEAMYHKGMAMMDSFVIKDALFSGRTFFDPITISTRYGTAPYLILILLNVALIAAALLAEYQRRKRIAKAVAIIASRYAP